MATMQSGEEMLVYLNRIREMASVLQTMDVAIDDKELAMAVLNGLPSRFGTIITALDAIGDDDDSFSFDKVRSRLLQEEKRWATRSRSQFSNRTSALLRSSSEEDTGNQKNHCTHCGRNNHNEPYC